MTPGWCLEPLRILRDAKDGPEGGSQIGNSVSAEELMALRAWQGEMIAPSHLNPQRVKSCEFTRAPFPFGR